MEGGLTNSGNSVGNVMATTANVLMAVILLEFLYLVLGFIQFHVTKCSL